jgi:hypothetical protein
MITASRHKRRLESTRSFTVSASVQSGGRLISPNKPLRDGKGEYWEARIESLETTVNKSESVPACVVNNIGTQVRYQLERAIGRCLGAPFCQSISDLIVDTLSCIAWME